MRVFACIIGLMLVSACAVAQPATSPEAQTTALMAAVEAGNLPGLQKLLQEKPDLHRRDRYGRHLLSCAAASRLGLPVVQCLLDAGARANAQDASGRTALLSAASRGYNDILRVLLEHGADPNIASPDEGAPLTMAAYRGSRECLEALLGAGARVNAQAKDGSTALMAAAFAGHVEIGRMLLERGADPGLRDYKGRTAGQLARERGLRSMAELLQSRSSSSHMSQEANRSVRSAGWGTVLETLR